VLADRLATLVEHGLLSRARDASHKQKVTYSLTKRTIDLVPDARAAQRLGVRHLPVADAYAARAQVLTARAVPHCGEAFMEELRETHLGTRRAETPDGPTVAERLDAAYAASAADRTE
jgi:hypothetical protein